jgi:hypothetical protein
LAFAPGCCGVLGPVPSTTLDKRRRLGGNGMLANAIQRVNDRLEFGAGPLPIGPEPPSLALRQVRIDGVLELGVVHHPDFRTVIPWRRTRSKQWTRHWPAVLIERKA